MQIEKAVILWAGCGRRISSEYGGMHKALIQLNGKSLMEHLLGNLRKAGIREIIAVLGYRAGDMQSMVESIWDQDRLLTVVNDRFDRTNNLYSLIMAEKWLKDRDFIVLNGDMVFDCSIIKDILTSEGSRIVVDDNDYGYQLDSPRVLIDNNRICDIGRHLSIDNAQGYAIGIYKFSRELSLKYFELGRFLAKERPEAGFHEPLPQLMKEYSIAPLYTCGREWMDVDEKGDVKRAEEMLGRLS